MSDDIRDIQSYYDTQVASEAERLERHQLERDLTWLYFCDYLPRHGHILEIGAATGAHTRWLAEHGYHVTAVDLSETLLRHNHQNLAAAGLADRVDFHISDARYLDDVPEHGFDAVLIMGPLYHLVDANDRRAAISEAILRLKKGGVLFASFISRLGILGDLMRNVPDWIEKQNDVRSILKYGRDPVEYPRGGFRGYFVRVDEIEALFTPYGLETLALAAVEPVISADDEAYNQLQGDDRRLWLELLYSISTERDLLAGSRHLLYIARKP